MESDLLKELAEDDTEYQEALVLVEQGWPKDLLTKYLRDYGSLPEDNETPEDFPFY